MIAKPVSGTPSSARSPAIRMSQPSTSSNPPPSAAPSIAAIVGIGLFFVSALMHGDLFHVVISFFQYIIMLPSFVNIFMVYAFW